MTGGRPVPLEVTTMPRPGSRAALLFFLLVVTATGGCGGNDKPKPPPVKYDYGYGDPPDLPKVASEFHDKPANQAVAPDKMALVFVNLDGKKVDLADFREKANVVLVVTKGMPQYEGGRFCPGCLAQLNSLVANHAEFGKRGAEVLAVFPGPSEKANEFLAAAKVREGDKPSPIPLLLDKDLSAVDRLGIRRDFAKPSTYILDKKGNVVYAFVGETTTDRPSVKALLARLDKLEPKD